jgi:hypothetical protein
MTVTKISLAVSRRKHAACKPKGTGNLSRVLVSKQKDLLISFSSRFNQYETVPCLMMMRNTGRLTFIHRQRTKGLFVTAHHELKQIPVNYGIFMLRTPQQVLGCHHAEIHSFFLSKGQVGFRVSWNPGIIIILSDIKKVPVCRLRPATRYPACGIASMIEHENA